MNMLWCIESVWKEDAGKALVLMSELIDMVRLFRLFGEPQGSFPFYSVLPPFRGHCAWSKAVSVSFHQDLLELYRVLRGVLAKMERYIARQVPRYLGRLDDHVQIHVSDHVPASRD